MAAVYVTPEPLASSEPFTAPESLAPHEPLAACSPSPLTSNVLFLLLLSAPVVEHRLLALACSSLRTCL